MLYDAHLYDILYKKVIYITYSALYSTNLNQNKMFGKYRNSKKDSSYLTGLEVGKNIAIHELRDVQNYQCINLTQEEKQKVMEFLIENNLEFGYNVESGGFYVLKKLTKSE